MVKPKTQIMAEMKARRKAAGLKRVEFWLTEAEAKAVKNYISRMERHDKNN